MICTVEKVSFAYRGVPRNALSEVSLTVDPGKHIALVGPNGAGKSTLLRLITGYLEPQHGSVTVFGRLTRNWTRRDMARQLAVVSQAGDLNVRISVRDLVSMGRHPYLRGWEPLSRDDEAVVAECLEAVDLTAFADRCASQLSGGELQRARLARALAQEPRLLLLDEPTAHLDLGHEARFMELLGQLQVERGLTVIAVTHHLNVAARHADEMVLMAEGRVLARGPAVDVFASGLLETAFGWPVDIADLGPLGLHAIPRIDARRGDDR